VEPVVTLDGSQRRTLLELGRESITRGLESGRLAPWPAPPDDRGLAVRRATFITLHRDGELRGCCGTLDARAAVAEDVWRNAWASAFADPRFLPLMPHEYAGLELQISVLSPLEPMAAACEDALIETLRPQVDGLVLEAGAQRATFLPAVWEQVPEPRKFVLELKRKAGWSAHHWPAGLRAYRYTTECFGTAH
jgi:AmmeMemoRadiSam system protein A